MPAMSTLRMFGPPLPAALQGWLPLAYGLAALYVPTVVELASTIWQAEEHVHGAIVLVVTLWLFWQSRQRWLAADTPPRPVAGFALAAFGLVLYVLGRSQDILLFEIGSLIPVLAGALLAMRGTGALRGTWFPLVYIVFMIPLPGILVDAATGPLKQWISVIAESLLYHAGYPVARTGVMLTVGQYQLMVADACSGLHSMFSLSALGLLFMYLMRRSSWLHNGIMLASILPIAFVANILRVLVLVLVTYYLGDEAGQGFLHGTAGILLLVIALMCLFGLDEVLGKLIPERSRP